MIQTYDYNKEVKEMKKIMTFVMAATLVMGMTTMTAFAAPRRVSSTRSLRRAAQTVCTGIGRNANNYLKTKGTRGGGRGVGLRDGSCLKR